MENKDINEEKTKKSFKKIDVHAHITNRTVDRIAPKTAWIDTLIPEIEKYNVEKTVLLASYFPHKGTGISNFRLMNWINERVKYHSQFSLFPRQYSEFLMFASLDFEHYFWQGCNEIEELANMKKIKGIKVYTTYQKIDFNSFKMNNLVKIAEQNNLLMMFHSGQPHSYTKYNSDLCELFNPYTLEKIAKESSVNFVISHMNGNNLDSLIDVLKRNKNIYTDMGGLFNSQNERNLILSSIDGIKRVLGETGPEKLLFATDFPLQTHEDSTYLIEEAMKNYLDADKQKVYYDNAKKLLRL